MTAADGKTMTIGISVDGDEIAAYACNGTDDEAWFFGNQTDGAIDIKSKFRDTLKASFDGTDVDGDLTMNGVTYDSPPHRCPAGGHVHRRTRRRARVLGRPPDGSAIGVQFNGGITGRDFEQAELQQLNDAAVPARRCATSGACSRPSRSVRWRTRARARRSTATTVTPTWSPAPCAWLTTNSSVANGPAGVLDVTRRGRSLSFRQNRTLHAPRRRSRSVAAS